MAIGKSENCVRSISTKSRQVSVETEKHAYTRAAICSLEPLTEKR